MSLLNLLEEFIMFEKIRKMKNKKGFTLVELIVVLVILAILAALLIPALTGYIDKANQEKVIAECRSVTMAAQTTASEYYGLNKGLNDATNQGTAITQINKLAEVPTTTTGSTTKPNWYYTITVGTGYVVTEVIFDDGTSSITYKKDASGATEFSTVRPSDGLTASTITGPAIG